LLQNSPLNAQCKGKVRLTSHRPLNPLHHRGDDVLLFLHGHDVFLQLLWSPIDGGQAAHRCCNRIGCQFITVKAKAARGQAAHRFCKSYAKTSGPPILLRIV
jgi:hypothetical protein